MRFKDRLAYWPYAQAFACAAFLMACSDATGPASPGGGGGGGSVARIEIEPSALVLTQAGETASLAAVAYDASGNEIEADVTWTSSHPGQVSVSVDGTATAAAELGSSLITATADGLSSDPALAVVAQPGPGVILVPDEAILSDPEPVDPNADYGPGWQYRIRVTSGSAQTGDLVLGTGGRALAGRVVSVSASGGAEELTVEFVPLTDLFANLRIDELIPMVEVGASSGTGNWLAPEPFGRQPGAMDVRADTSFKLGRFECKASGSTPDLDLPEPTYHVNQGLALDIAYDGGLRRLTVVGDISADFKYAPTFKAVFEGKIGCETVLTTVTVPLTGFLSWFVGIQVPIGIGAELEGKLEIAEVGFDVSAQAAATAELGLNCPGGGGACTGETGFAVTRRDFNFEFTAPDPTEQFKVELGAHAFLFAKPSVGSRFSSKVQFEFLSAGAGVKQSVDLAALKRQIDDDAYSSEFQLTGVLDVGAGSGIEKTIEKLEKWLGTDLELDLSLIDIDEPLAQSPRGTFTISPSSVEPGDDSTLGELATFTVELDPITYLGIDAVDRIEIFWKKDDGSGGYDLEHARPLCSVLPASSGQKTFTCQTDFLEEHSGQMEFVAFVHAEMFGLPIPIPLEVGNAALGVGEPLEDDPAGAFAFPFEEDLEGWQTGTTSDGWGTAQWREWCGDDRSEGCVKLDGVGGEGIANAWIFKTFDLPDDATTLELETAAHNREGSDSEYRIRVVDDAGSETILVDWTTHTGGDADVYDWNKLSLSISAFAGRTVTIYLEGGDNDPGVHEQTYYDNVVIR